jgi:response regulator NasT
MGAESSPKIAIVDESPIRAAILEEGLREAGFTDVVRISEMQSLLSRIYALDPDVIVIDLENPSRDVLEQMFQVSRAVRRPIAMFVDQSDAASIQASVDAGGSSRSSISVFHASTPFPGSRMSSIAPNPRSKTARSSTAPRES